jgi:hypothetical protein
MKSWRLTLVNVWQDTTLCDCDVSENLVIAGSIASQLENFCREVFEDGREIDGST